MITTLEQSEMFYDAQYGEARVVANAYRNFGSRVANLKKKLEEHMGVLPLVSWCSDYIIIFQMYTSFVKIQIIIHNYFTLQICRSNAGHKRMTPGVPLAARPGQRAGRVYALTSQHAPRGRLARSAHQ